MLTRTPINEMLDLDIELLLQREYDKQEQDINQLYDNYQKEF